MEREKERAGLRCAERDDLKRRKRAYSRAKERERRGKREGEKRLLDRGVKVGTELLGRATRAGRFGVGQARSQ